MTFSEYQLFNDDGQLHLSNPTDPRNGGEWEEHVNGVSREILEDLRLEAGGSRDKARRLIKERRADRKEVIEEYRHAIEPRLPKIRDLLTYYYEQVRQHLEASGKVELVAEKRRKDAARRRDHNARLVGQDRVNVHFEKELRLIDQNPLLHLEWEMDGLWNTICWRADWDQVEKTLDHLKEKYFVPPQADYLRHSLKAQHMPLEDLQARLYRIHERLEMEERYLVAYLEGMPAPHNHEQSGQRNHETGSESKNGSSPEVRPGDYSERFGMTREDIEQLWSDRHERVKLLIEKRFRFGDTWRKQFDAICEEAQRFGLEKPYNKHSTMRTALHRFGKQHGL